jgi:predicted O-methyltransferase YrrM
MKDFFRSLRRAIDFALCAGIFPEIKGQKYCFKNEGLHSLVDEVFLYMSAKELSARGDVLEIGSFEGVSGMVLAAGNRASKRAGKVWLIEPAPLPNKEEFLHNFKANGFVDDIYLIDATSEDARKIVETRFRFIFVDGNHEYEYAKKDIMLWKDLLNEGGVIAFHDRTYHGVVRATDEMLRDDPAFKVIGVIGDIMYMTKGDPLDAQLFSRFKRLESIRSGVIRIAKKLKIKQ